MNSTCLATIVFTLLLIISQNVLGKNKKHQNGLHFVSLFHLHESKKVLIPEELHLLAIVRLMNKLFSDGGLLIRPWHLNEAAYQANGARKCHLHTSSLLCIDNWKHQ